jgi:hypothetical protein
VLGINQFSDMTEEEFIARNTGLIIPQYRSDKMKDFKFSTQEQLVYKR